MGKQTKKNTEKRRRRRTNGEKSKENAENKSNQKSEQMKGNKRVGDIAMCCAFFLGPPLPSFEKEKTEKQMKQNGKIKKERKHRHGENRKKQNTEKRNQSCCCGVAYADNFFRPWTPRIIAQSMVTVPFSARNPLARRLLRLWYWGIDCSSSQAGLVNLGLYTWRCARGLSDPCALLRGCPRFFVEDSELSLEYGEMVWSPG